MSTYIVISLVVTVVILAVYAALPRLLAWRGVMLVPRTKFGPALIFDSEDAGGAPIRLLNVGNTFQSVSYVDEAIQDELPCIYHRSFADVMARAGRVRDVLVVGGGGFSYPRYLVAHDDDVRVDAVEIDPAVIKIAREHFFLDRAEAGAAGRLNVVCGDGWTHLREHHGEYDVVVNDAFSGSRPLGPLSTEEGARVVHENLRDGGLYLANLRCPLEGRRSRALDATLVTFAREFAHVWLIPEWPDQPRTLANNALVACDRELDLGAGAIAWHDGWREELARLEVTS